MLLLHVPQLNAPRPAPRAPRLQCLGNVTSSSQIRQLQAVLFEVEVLASAAASSCILLKGQMLYLEDVKAIVFLCSPL